MRPFVRLRSALLTVPTGRDWLEAAGAMLGLALVLGPLGAATGLFVIQSRPWIEVGAIALAALFIPAFLEEALFRGFLPGRNDPTPVTVPVAGSVIAFVGWHVVETIWLPGAAPVFLRWDFLVAAGLIGLACAILRIRSGSLWTAVVVHWLAVAAWQSWLGGPRLTALMS